MDRAIIGSEKIAEIIKTEYTDKTIPSDERGVYARAKLKSIATLLCNFFERENKNFNGQEFLKSCGMKE